MIRNFVLLALMMCPFLNSSAQKNDAKPNAPKKNIQVNREYDDQGNLIRFDSVYSYSWSGDTTLLHSISPEDFPDLLGKHFGNFPDSLFFGGFDPFQGSFEARPDSIRKKIVGLNQRFLGSEFYPDSLAFNQHEIDHFFRNFGQTPNDSIVPNSPGLPNGSMDELLRIVQEQMKQMEALQKEFFKEHPKGMDF